MPFMLKSCLIAEISESRSGLAKIFVFSRYYVAKVTVRFVSRQRLCHKAHRRKLESLGDISARFTFSKYIL